MLGQNMCQETVDEFHRRKSGGFPSAFLPDILEPECDHVIFNADNPVVADGCGMGVSADILHHFSRS